MIFQLKSLKYIRVFAVGLLCVVCIISLGYSQIQQTTLPLQLSLKPEQLQSKEFQERLLLQSAGIVMEGPIEAEYYRTGPGDELFVSVGNISPAIEFPLIVLPEGVVSIPDIGDTSVKSLTLLEAKIKINELLQKIYPDSNISITLTKIRIFFVRLTGDVEQPGIRYANATWRVSDIIDQSGGLKKWANGSAVEIRHSNGTTECFDYWRYKNYGRQMNNTLLLDGDEIYVPGRDFEKGMVFVQSSPLRSGFYQYLEGETVLEFINRGLFEVDKKMITGSRANQNQIDPDLNPIDVSNIAVIRNNQDNGESTTNLTIDVNGIEREYIGNYLLQPGDVLVLPVISQYVFVDGEVASRGEIEWIANRSASYYVGIAGRTSNATKNEGIKITRLESGEEFTGEDIVIYPGDHIFVPKKRHILVREWLEFVGPFVSLIIAGKAVGAF